MSLGTDTDYNKIYVQPKEIDFALVSNIQKCVMYSKLSTGSQSLKQNLI